MTQSPPPADMTLQRSSRDADDVRARLTGWLATVLPEGADPEVTVHAGIQTNGMSSETVLLGITASEDGERVTREYVARVAPAPGDLPVFPEYRLSDQYEAMRLAGELAGVPVPPVGLNETTGDVLGTPFFLMERLDGAVPCCPGTRSSSVIVGLPGRRGAGRVRGRRAHASSASRRSGSGDAARSVFVYSCCGCSRTSSAGPRSTTDPRNITMMSSLKCRAVARSCVM